MNKSLKTCLSFCMLILVSISASANTKVVLTPPRLPAIGGIPASFTNQPLPRIYDVGYANWSYQTAVGAGDTAYETLLNQGLAFYHVFHYLDAVRAFNQAAQLQPQAILPRLGIAFSAVKLGNDQNAILTAVQEYKNALQLLNANGASLEETFWVEFVGAALNAMTGVSLPRNTSDSIQTLFNNYPNKDMDIEYLVLGTNMLTDINAISSMQIIVDNYQKALLLNGRHEGAVHYLTHIYEMLDDKKNAVAYGKLTADFSPESAHAQHMYGHNLPIFGDWKAAEVQFAKADVIHKQWAKENNVPLTYDWHYTHNLFLWGYAKVAAGMDQDSAAQTMLEACETSGRHHCLTSFYAIASFGDVKKLEKIIEFLNTSGDVPAAQFLSTTANWLGLIPGPQSERQALARQYSNPQANFMYYINEMIEGRQISDAEIAGIKNNLLSQLTRSGFDAWSQILPVSMLMESVAIKKGNTKVEKMIAEVYQAIKYFPKR